MKKLLEDSRNQLLNKSRGVDAYKDQSSGKDRYQRRIKSKVSTTVSQYNKIDMNKLFKENILNVDINIKGETDDYVVKISFGGFMDVIKSQLKAGNEFNLRTVIRSLMDSFNRNDVYVHCSCPDFKYRFSYWSTRNGINSGNPENRPANETNPNDSKGIGCKHILLCLSNTSWIIKVASTIFNYVNYMEQHYKKLYADIIYPALYDKQYQDDVQMDLETQDKTDLDTDSDTIDTSNKWARTKNQFQQGNQQGVRFAPNNAQDVDGQMSFDDVGEE